VIFEGLIVLAFVTAAVAVYFYPNITRRAYTVVRRFRQTISALFAVALTLAFLSTGSFYYTILGFLMAVYIVLFVHYETEPIAVVSAKIRSVTQ